MSAEFVQSYTYCYGGLSQRQRLRDKLRWLALRQLKLKEGKVVDGCEITRVTIINPEDPFTEVIIEGRQIA